MDVLEEIPHANRQLVPLRTGDDYMIVIDCMIAYTPWSRH